MGKLFVFEGPDGVGKTTTVHAVLNELSLSGNDCESLSFPGNAPGSIGQHIYKIHHEPEKFGIASISPLSLQLLHIAAHIDAIENRILPQLKNQDLLLDRFWWSTWVYGLAAGIPIKSLELALNIEKEAWKETTPTCVFLLSRDGNKNTQLQKLYQDLAEREANNYPIHCVDNNAPHYATRKLIIDIIQNSYS